MGREVCDWRGVMALMRARQEGATCPHKVYQDHEMINSGTRLSIDHLEHAAERREFACAAATVQYDKYGRYDF